MFKTKLPSSCPPIDSDSRDMVLYRLFVPDDICESFKSHTELFPDNSSYKMACKAHGLSFFDNLDSIKELLEKENNIGKIIVQVEIKKELGVLTKKRTSKGHYTLWLYNTANLTNVNYTIVEND